MSYANIVICIGPDRFLETWPPIYRGQERPARDRLRVSQVHRYVYSWYTPCLTDLYLRVHPMPYSPNPKSFILDICRINPCQWQSGVAQRGAGMQQRGHLLPEGSGARICCSGISDPLWQGLAGGSGEVLNWSEAASMASNGTAPVTTFVHRRKEGNSMQCNKLAVGCLAWICFCDWAPVWWRIFSSPKPSF
jgi:hypothetical protein